MTFFFVLSSTKQLCDVSINAMTRSKRRERAGFAEDHVIAFKDYINYKSSEDIGRRSEEEKIAEKNKIEIGNSRQKCSLVYVSEQRTKRVLWSYRFPSDP